MAVVFTGIVGCAFIWALIFRPEIVAVFFFTITIADINFELPGGLNIRAVMGICVFMRTVIGQKGDDFPPFMSSNGIYIVLFLFYTVFVTMAYDLVDMPFVKTIALTIISTYCGYYYYYKKETYTYLKLSLIISALICFSDLIYTYSVVGKFPVQRIYMQMLHMTSEVDEKGDFIEVINHGFYGLICGLTFVFLLNEFIYQRNKNKISLILMPIMFLGVLMSTSRSTLLGIIGIAIYLIGTQLRSKETSKKAAKLITMGVSLVFLSLFVFTSLQVYFNLSSTFIDAIAGRLVDEPIAVFKKHMGFNYNAQALDALEWRGEASSNAFEAFLSLKPVEQYFGIGFWGFVTRDLGRNNLPPHNGMLMLLIESGITGLVMYVLLIISVIRKSFMTHANISPLITGLIFIIIYCIGQNAELTTSTTFLFVISIIAESQVNAKRTAEEESETATETAPLQPALKLREEHA